MGCLCSCLFGTTAYEGEDEPLLRGLPGNGNGHGSIFRDGATAESGLHGVSEQARVDAILKEVHRKLVNVGGGAMMWETYEDAGAEKR